MVAITFQQYFLHGSVFASTTSTMDLNALLQKYSQHPQVKPLALICQRQEPARVWCEGLQASSAPVVLAALTGFKNICRPFLVVLNDEEEAGYFYHDLMQLLDDEQVAFFPSTYRRAVKYGQRDAANEILRMDVLNRLTKLQQQPPQGPVFIVTFPAALTEKVASQRQMEENTLQLEEGGSYDLTTLTRRLLEIGFKSRDYVYEPGEFAVRGSILDIYSFSSEQPYRIDFFGDEIDSIRTFEVQTQLSVERKKGVSIVPEVEQGKEEEGVPFTDFLPKSTCLISRNLNFVYEKVEQVYQEGFTRQALAAEAANSEMEEAEIQQRLVRENLLVGRGELERHFNTLQRIDIGTHPSCALPETTLHFQMRPQPLFHKNFDLVRQHFSQVLADGYSIYMLAESQKQNERLKDILEAPDNGKGLLGSFTPVCHTLHEGFYDDSLKLCLFTDHQLFDRYHKYNLRSDHARDAKMALTLKELMKFEPGDFVVHVDHGVGRFAGLVRMVNPDGSMQEVIKILYQNDDVVFVSIHALHKISKYKGKEGEPPRLSKLGTGAWEKMKERTKKKIKDIARDLIRLYSRRKEEKGFAFSPDSFMQHELEASFAYEDTPDQLRVTQEVKADMERPLPMDRLVCGDVGFGKTEIAVRAAMKAAADSKQVAVLVPTTVLALQHYKTFASRLKNFPVRVDYLSRARTPQQTKALLHDLEEGKIDIVVGTHKLIGKSVRFKDLGLLIIDEEQKFGVAVKEKLRQLKVNVDTLTMSATPIPRTLQFSLMGARDFSVIQTPPPNRHPIQTEIHTFNHEIIADAINFELSRNGQVYIVTHRVAALESLANLVKQHVPDARVVTGHGQMSPTELEKVIMDFANHDYDVLISTTIVENGIDIPNANTIIIDNAHHFGLSDLHQMRGRVGRGNRKAFCYLLAPPLSLLNDESRRRLEAIENFSDLGSGIHIAMQDLDIRGAGNLLGSEQSGFIADLGYETYQKILAEAISELKNEEFADLYAEEIKASQESVTGELFVNDCSVECDLRAYFPEDYVPGSSERMLLYRELDSLTNEAQIEAFRSRMEDRFGPLPPEGEELLRVVPLRLYGRKAGAERLLLKNGKMTLYFVSHNESPFYQSATFGHIIDYAAHHYRKCMISEEKGHRRMWVKEVTSVEQALTTLKTILQIS